MFWQIKVAPEAKRPYVRSGVLYMPLRWIATVYVMTWEQYNNFIMGQSIDIEMLDSDDKFIVFYVDRDYKDFMPEAYMYVRVDT